MCGIAGIVGVDVPMEKLERMNQVQFHRGPDAGRVWRSDDGCCGLAHRRLSILDLSPAGTQPLADPSGRHVIAYNGEIYNYLELKAELARSYEFKTGTDTEVLLAAYLKWGPSCLDRLIGMFAFIIWDTVEKKAFAARDRFGVKPLFYHKTADGLMLGSEIKALHAAGIAAEANESAWATYFCRGVYDHAEFTFWKGVKRLEPGCQLTWSEVDGLNVSKWYDAADQARQSGMDGRSDEEVSEELTALLKETVRLRFRSDVPVGVCLSGGLDSSLLVGLVGVVHGAEASLKTFTFICGDENYDETPWVRQMVENTRHDPHFCLLTADEIPALAERVADVQDEPFGGFPTMGMAKVHQRARAEGVTVLLDGNGLDEGWAGYEYYRRAASVDASTGPVQGSKTRSTRPECLVPEFRLLEQEFVPPRPFEDPVLDLQYRDLRHSKIPRGMRFADRVSMMESRELREPFLDHRIVELGLRQPVARKIRSEQGKRLAREVAARLLPSGVREAPKRPVQTPQREWIRGPLKGWTEELIESALASHGQWFDADLVRREWRDYLTGASDNSFYIWQWMSLGLLSGRGSN